MKSQRNGNREANYDNAGFLSKMFFIWVTPFFMKSFNHALDESEIFNISSTDTTANMTKILQQQWDMEKQKKNPSLFKSISRIFWRKYMLLGILIFLENLFCLCQPLIIWKLLSSLKTIETALPDTILYASLFIMSVILIVVSRNPYYFYAFKMGMQIKVGIGGMIYQKVLRLNQKALGQTTTGHIINLLSNDIQRFELGLAHLHYLWLGPVITVAAISMLYFLSREGGLVAILIFLILIPIQIGLGKWHFKLRCIIALISDERIKMVSELINGMQVVKMYCWETMFIKIIGQLRRKLLLYNFLRKAIKSLWVVLRFCGGRFIILSFMVTGFMLDQSLSSQVVWMTVILINQIRGTIVDRFSLAVNHFGDLKVTLSRVQKFLSLSEFESFKYPCLDKISAEKSDDKACPSIEFQNVCASWNEVCGQMVLQDVSFSVKAPETCAIIGEIGSGKSAVFLAILGELPLNKGMIRIQGTVAYASQQPWIFSGSIQENILFNRPYLEEEYKKILHATTIDKDIKEMCYGDLTLVGERGVLLSGGQRARISLARAAYQNTDIVMLDDPLAAVDTTVGSKIFSDCISNLFKNKLVLLITHQMHLLQHVDKVIVLNEGKMIAFGSLQEIISEGIDLQSILKTESHQPLPEFFSKTISQESTSISTFVEGDDLTKNTHNLYLASTREEVTPLLCSIFSSEKMGNVSKLSDNVTNADILETFKQGNVPCSLYWQYFTVGCPSIGVIMIILFYTGTMFLYVFCDLWLSWWTQEMDMRNISSPEFYKDDYQYLTGFVYFTVATFVFGTVSVLLLFLVCLCSSKALHDEMLHAILHSPISFFNDTSAGRILNRFSKDISIADELLPITLQDLILTNWLVLFGVGVACYKNYWGLVMIVPLFILLMILRRCFLNISCSVKRIDAVTRSPLYAHICTTLQGLSIIRAFRSQEWFINDFQKKQDRNSKAFFLYICASRWFAFRLDEICCVFITMIVYSCIILVYFKKINASEFGLLLTYIIGLIGLTQWAIRQSTEVENQMIAIERIFEYMSLPSESPMVLNPKDGSLMDWPQQGKIVFENVSLYYENSDKTALKNINLTIEDREKIGIIGRTGAGKSSLISVLFRLVELADDEGRVLIDNEDISQLGLMKVRSAMSVIPQDPVMFMGSIRINLDPFSEFSDDELWCVLETVELMNTIEQLPEKLYSSVSEGGSNLSVGQRQLICMARALLKRAKIIVIDEATANVDPHTDNLIQSTLKTTFGHCTVLTIAHRLNTVMDSDKIIVMDNGRVVEFDHPYNLFNGQPSSLFRQMVKQTGSKEEDKLRKIAQINFLKNERFSSSRQSLFLDD